MTPRDQSTADWMPGGIGEAGPRSVVRRGDTTNLADILERVLDKGIVIAGDIVVCLVDVELLTIRLRLLVASVDKAREMGINWWETDPWLNRDAAADDEAAPKELTSRLERLEGAVDRLADALESGRTSR